MSLTHLLFSPSDRLAPKPFVLAVILVYLVGIMSQALLSVPVLARFGVWPFALAQIMLLWIWFALHSKRLHDAGRGVGTAVAIVFIYALAAILLSLFAAYFFDFSAREQGTTELGPAGTIFALYVMLYLIGQILGDPQLSAIGLILVGLLALALLPALLAVCFSVRTGLRPQAAPTK